MASQDVKVLGLKELEQNLKDLGEQLRERGVRRMMAKAAVPMRDEAKRRAPVLATPDERRKPGTVRDAIKLWRKRGTAYAVTYYVGVRGLSRRAISMFKANNARGGRAANAADNPNDPYYWRFLEFGTRNMAARPFLRPAFEAMKMHAVQVALDEGRDFVRRAARRLKRVKP